MLEVSIFVEFIIHALRGAVYENWREDKVLLRRFIMRGSVEFGELRVLLGDLIDLWPSIRPFIRCTGLPRVKERVDSPSIYIFI